MIKAEMGLGDDLMMREIGGLPNNRMLIEIAWRRSNDPANFADPGRDQRRIGQMGEAKGKVDTFIDKVRRAIKESETDIDSRIGVKKRVDNRPQYFFTLSDRRRDRQKPARRGSFARCDYIRFFQIGEHASTSGQIPLARFAQPQ